MNLTHENAVEATLSQVSKYLTDNEQLYAIVNNAGLMLIAEFEWLTEEQIKEQIQVNLVGPLLLTKAFLPLIRSHKARVINVASHCGIKPLPGFSVYAATKAGLKFWTEALQKEMKKFGVKVVTFIPGEVLRDFKGKKKLLIWTTHPPKFNART